MNANVIPQIIDQHCDEASFLWGLRQRLLSQPHISLANIADIDERIEAHLDGLRIAGKVGWKICEAQLSSEENGAMFTAMVMALESKDKARVDKLFALAESAPTMRTGFHSAFGWISTQFLKGTVKDLLASPSPFHRLAAIACCTLHRVDAREAIADAINNADAKLRTRALRAAGELGRRDLITFCEKHMKDKDITCRFWAAWSAALLGEHQQSIKLLKTFFTPGPLQERAMQLALMVMPVTEAHDVLKIIANDPAQKRQLIKGAGIVGDPFYVSWLIKQMETIELSRLAGESFSLITGLDLASLHLEGKPPENFQSGPNDDPNDTNVTMEDDENLPWPDPQKIQAWWKMNQSSFPNGNRFFMGQPVNVENCKKVLREGYQRQRVTAALHLSLLQPESILFPTSAPTWRQQRWLKHYK